MLFYGLYIAMVFNVHLLFIRGDIQMDALALLEYPLSRSDVESCEGKECLMQDVG